MIKDRFGKNNNFYGHKHSEETKKHWSEIRKGVKHTEETKKKMSIARTGKHKAFTEKCRVALIKNRLSSPFFVKGEGHPRWVGNSIKYSGLHKWVRSVLGKPTECEHCGVGGWLHWANVSGQYLRESGDWIALCPKCHKIYDSVEILAERRILK